MSRRDDDPSTLPAHVRALVEDAGRLDREKGKRGEHIWDLLVSSDCTPAWNALRTVPRGKGVFLEFGSGVGAVTLMAAALGFKAHGIDVNPDLVETSTALAKRHDLVATFVTGTFIPTWYDRSATVYDDDMKSSVADEDAYEKLGLGIADFDVMYAFPWPEEVGLFMDILDRGGQPGAHLILNLGSEGMRVVRHA